MDKDLAIGIDLGTTFSCAAVVDGDRIKMIYGDDGLYTMASSIFIKKCGEFTVGNSARDMFYKNPKQSIYGVKRLIGRTYEEYLSQKDSLKFLYNVVEKGGRIKIETKYKDGMKYFFPEELSAMVLTKLVKRAEENLRRKISKVVITVPAHFNSSQRRATRNAANIAGLEVLRIINEPTAAILAYELEDKYKNCQKNVLVYDFGGGTFDVTIATINKGKILVRATNGEPYLGGDDIDNNLVDYFVEIFNEKHHINLQEESSGIERSIFRLRNAAEKAKIYLSQNTASDVSIDYLYKDIDFDHTLTRKKFEQINDIVFRKTLKCIEQTLKEAKMIKADIDEIVLIGGSTRIPLIRELVKEYFGKEVNASIHPDEAVAIGAARQAAISLQMYSTLTKSIQLQDVTSLSLGMRVLGRRMSIIIPKNTTIPDKRTERYYTTVDNQTEMSIPIFEGERKMANDNRFLESFNIENLNPAPKGQTQVNVTFELDENGILHASAVEVGNSNNLENLQVNLFANMLSEDEINKMVADAQRYWAEDNESKEKAEAKILLTDKIYDINKAVKQTSDISGSDEEFIINACENVNEWIKQFEQLTISEIKEKEMELTNICTPVIKKYKPNFQ